MILHLSLNKMDLQRGEQKLALCHFHIYIVMVAKLQ
jgi:hypothetical protein